MHGHVARGVVLLSLSACAVDRVETSSTAGMTFEQRLARTPREPGTGHFVVDGDLVLYSEEELRAFHDQVQQGALAIYAINGVDVRWGAAQQRQLTYCISDAFGARKATVVTAMRAATEQGWEGFANVDFIHVPAQDASCNSVNANVLFDVSPITGAPYLARSFFPNATRSARNVLIDAEAFNLTGSITLQAIVAHELGHILGFRHEHIRPEAAATASGCLEDTTMYRGVTPYDSASIMHFPQCNGTSQTLAFTQRDRDGVALVYGPPGQNAAPMTQIVTPANGANVSPSFTVEATVIDTNLARAELVIDGVVASSLTAPPFRFEVTNLAVGNHLLEVEATDTVGAVASQTVSITVVASGPGGSGTGAGDAPVPDLPGSESPNVSGGCRTGAGSERTGAAWLLAVVALRRSRRRREGHCGIPSA